MYLYHPFQCSHASSAWALRTRHRDVIQDCSRCRRAVLEDCKCPNCHSGVHVQNENTFHHPHPFLKTLCLQMKPLCWWRSISNGRESACPCRRFEFDPWLGRSPGEGNANPLQYSCLGDPMDRGAWQATVHGDRNRVRHDLGTKQQQSISSD